MEYTTRSLVTAFITLVVLSAVEPRAVGSKFTVCKVKDKNFQDCFKTSAEKAIQGVLSDGIPEYGVIPLDPLFVPRMILKNGDGAVGLTLNLENSTHTGLRNAKVVSVRADPKNYKFDFKIRLPFYSVTGPYEASGRIILLPITGKGNSNFTYENLDVDWMIHGKPKTDSHGKTYMDVEKFDVKIHSDQAYIMMTGLFNGDKTLSEMMHKFLNEHQKDFIQEMEPALNEAFSQLYLALSKQIFKRLPYNEIFPDL